MHINTHAYSRLHKTLCNILYACTESRCCIVFTIALLLKSRIQFLFSLPSIPHYMRCQLLHLVFFNYPFRFINRFCKSRFVCTLFGKKKLNTTVFCIDLLHLFQSMAMVSYHTERLIHRLPTKPSEDSWGFTAFVTRDIIFTSNLDYT